MPIVKKIDWRWEPSEKRNLQVGETIDLPNVQALIEQGSAVYADEQGNEILYPKNMKYKFPVVLNTRQEIVEFFYHFTNNFEDVPEERREPSEQAVVAQAESEEKTDTELILEAIRAKKEARKAAKEKKV